MNYFYLLLGLACWLPNQCLGQCKTLRKHWDERSPYITIYMAEPQAISAYKIVTGGPPLYHLSLSGWAEDKGDSSGVLLELSTGDRLHFPLQPVYHHAASASLNRVRVYTDLLLSEQQLSRLAQQRIERYRLGSLMKVMDSQQGALLQEQINCLLLAKPIDIKRKMKRPLLLAAH